MSMDRIENAPASSYELAYGSGSRAGKGLGTPPKDPRNGALVTLRANAERLELALRATEDGVWDRDLASGKVYVSPRWRELLGYEADEFPDATGQFESHLHPEDRARAAGAMRRHLESREPYRVELRLRTKSGNYRWFQSRGQATWDADGKPVRITGALRDITADRELRESLTRLQDLYAALQRTNRTIVRIVEPVALFKEVCRIAVEHGHFGLAWIGTIGDPDGHIDLAASHSSARNVLRGSSLPLFDYASKSCKVTAEAIRTGRYQVVNDLLADVRLADCTDIAMQGDIRSMASLPLHEAGRVVGVLNLYGHATDFFSDPLVALLREMAMDVSFALDNIRRRREHGAADAALRNSEENFRQLAANIPHIFWIAEARSKRVIYVSPAYETIFGRPGDELTQGNFDWVEAVHPADRARVRAAYQDGEGEAEFNEEYRIVRPDGSYRWLHARAFPVSSETGETTRIAGIVRDITEQRELESRLDHLVNFDSLTGLPNRLLFHDRLKQTLAQVERASGIAAVMLVDLDHFKLLNETLGRAAGDVLLQEAALRLSRVAGVAHTVARLGADEFALTIPDLSAGEDAGPVAQQIMAAFEQPFEIAGNETFVNVSVGIAMYPADGVNADALLRDADIAMYRAKELGRGRFQFYAAEMNARSVERLTMSKHLRRALERKEFSVCYQPKVELSSGAITGFEALLRWNNPELGETLPAVFVPMLEENGQIVPVGAWILDCACEQIRSWMDRGITPVPIAVNVSERQLLQPDFEASIKAIIDRHRVEPRMIELEMTESVLIQHQDRVVVVLRNLKLMGIRLAIDDFGTGYSSLSYLRRFPLNTLKIDRSFVVDLIKNGDAALITQAVIAMALKLRLRVVAEGVENQAQLAFLAACGCDEIQGFYFSPPVAADESTRMLVNQRKLALPASDGKDDARTLLLVDDEVHILAALKRVLRRDGYRILTATSAAEGLELLACNKVAVVMSDQRMPGLSGVDFLRQVADLYPDTVRMMLSGYTDFSSITGAINRGAIFKFLSKPWDDKQLRDTVGEAFRRHGNGGEGERRKKDRRSFDAGALPSSQPVEARSNA